MFLDSFHNSPHTYSIYTCLSEDKDLPLRASSDVHSCLPVPEDGQVLIREVDHSVVACFPKLKLWPSTYNSGGALRQEKVDY